MTFLDYCRTLARKAERAPKHVRLHALLFAATNAFLVLINGILGFSFPWFLFPLGGWAILLVDHYVLSRQRRLHDQEARTLDELSPHQTRILRKLHRSRSTFGVFLASAVTTSLFLVMTNLIVSPHFPWSAIAAGGLALAALFHYAGFARRKNRLLEEVSDGLPEIRDTLTRRRSLGLGRRLAIDSTTSRESLEAFDLRTRIERRLLGLGETQSSLEAEVMPLLERYVEQIGRLVAQRDDIRELSRRSAKEELESEKTRLTAKLETARSEALKTEYSRAIAQLTGQLESLRELHEHVEIADLRVASALNSLKQLEIDVVRMKSLSDFEESAVSEMLEEKLGELSDYIDDLAEGRREIEEG